MPDEAVLGLLHFPPLLSIKKKTLKSYAQGMIGLV